MFRPLGWAVVISMAASLLVALTVVPVLSDLLLTRFGRRRTGEASPSRISAPKKALLSFGLNGLIVLLSPWSCGYVGVL